MRNQCNQAEADARRDASSLACCVTLAFVVCVAVLCLSPANAFGVDRIVYKKDGASKPMSGRIVAEAEDGGLLLLTPDGTLWPIQPDEYSDRSKDDSPFEPLKREEISQLLLNKLGPGFKVHTTANYIICYNTSTAYAQWCGALYERLYRGFRTFWETRGLELHDPELPLVALVFDSKESYVRHVRAELGPAADSLSIVGYYSPSSNHVNMYDLTGTEGVRSPNDRVNSTTLINQVLQRPEAAPMVATIVHEATHQLAYNCGLQTRFADNPVWVSEGLAMYFETPDLRNSKGWSSIGSVNRTRLIQYRKYAPRRPANALETLLRDDTRFREPASALDAYAEAWALNYFLLRTRSKEYVAYLKQLSAKPPVIYDDPETRLNEFRAAFGADLGKFDNEFQRYLKKLD